MNRIQQARYEYYINGIRLMSDEEYDNLTKNMERRVGIKRMYKEKVIHKEPMLSLENTYDFNEVISFFQKQLKKFGLYRDDIEYIISPKIDGIAMEIEYQNGVLHLASTRGDGYIGRNITEFASKFGNVRNKINKNINSVTFRGEAFITYQNLQRINEERITQYMPPYITPLQAVTSILNKLNPSQNELKKIFFAVHSCPLKSIYKWYEAEQFLLYTNENRTLNLDELSIWLQLLRNQYKSNSNIPIDGIVISIKDPKLCQILGNTKTAPRWSIAYKFK